MVSRSVALPLRQKCGFGREQLCGIDGQHQAVPRRIAVRAALDQQIVVEALLRCQQGGLPVEASAAAFTALGEVGFRSGFVPAMGAASSSGTSWISSMRG